MDEREGGSEGCWRLHALWVCACISVIYIRVGAYEQSSGGRKKKKELGPPFSGTQTIFLQQMKKEWACHRCFTVERQAWGSNQIQGWITVTVNNTCISYSWLFCAFHEYPAAWQDCSGVITASYCLANSGESEGTREENARHQSTCSFCTISAAVMREQNTDRPPCTGRAHGPAERIHVIIDVYSKCATT